MKFPALLVLIFLSIAIPSIMFKDWQCAEMFPDANRLACILWK